MKIANIREKFQCIEDVKEIVHGEIFKKTVKSLMRELAGLLDQVAKPKVEILHCVDKPMDVPSYHRLENRKLKEVGNYK